MALFVVSWLDKPDSLALRLANRADHLAYVASAGVVRLAGPYLNDKAEPIGSMIIVEVESEADAHAFNQADPYNKAGLIPSVDIRPWVYVAGQLP